jgi:hypothetical protein
MFAAQDPSSVMLIILVIAAAIVFYWRTVIKLITVGTLALVLLGLLELLRSMH